MGEKNNISVTHFCYSVSEQTAAFRLSKSLNLIDVQSNIYVGSRSVNRSGVVQPVRILDKLSAFSGLAL